MTAYTSEQIAAELATRPGWSVENGELARAYTFETYRLGVRFAVAVAQSAEDHDHHPTLVIGYKTVLVTVSTHDAGGITAKDFSLADAADGHYASIT